jgi:hypothetical protein
MKTISFRNALYAQVIWFLAATIFNVLSIVAIADGQTGWAGPTPASSQVIATIMATIIVFGFLAWRKTYLIAASVVLIVLALGGVGRHLVADASAYASMTTWAIAIGINVFGCLAFLAGLFYAK